MNTSTARLPVPDMRTLATRRTAISQAALAHPGPLHVVLYALTVPDRTPYDNLAASQALRSAGLRLTRNRLRPDGPRYLLSSPAPKPGPAGPTTGCTSHLEEVGSA
ncbi:hypothetical protein [Streptomyces goshikiensis]